MGAIAIYDHGAPDYFDNAGGDHHLFARVLDLEGKPVTSANLIIGWLDGFALLGQRDFAQPINLRMTPKAHNLGAPLTNVCDIGAYRVQGFAQGIVYAPVTDWSKVAHTSW